MYKLKSMFYKILYKFSKKRKHLIRYMYYGTESILRKKEKEGLCQS